MIFIIFLFPTIRHESYHFPTREKTGGFYRNISYRLKLRYAGSIKVLVLSWQPYGYTFLTTKRKGEEGENP